MAGQQLVAKSINLKNKIKSSNKKSTEILSKLKKIETSHNRELNQEQILFASKLINEIRKFQIYANKEQALIFQAGMPGYFRYLVHQVVRIGFRDDGLVSVSINGYENMENAKNDRRVAVFFQDQCMNELCELFLGNFKANRQMVSQRKFDVKVKEKRTEPFHFSELVIDKDQNQNRELSKEKPIVSWPKKTGRARKNGVSEQVLDSDSGIASLKF